MVTPVNVTYSATLGGTIYAGRTAGLPAWLVGHAVNEMVSIPGTIHAGSPGGDPGEPANKYGVSNTRLAYSNTAVIGNRVYLAATGGHLDSSDNRVTSTDITVDSPAWELDIAASTTVVQLVPYYPDGKPSSSHRYWSVQYSSARGLLMLHCSRFVYGGPGTSFLNTNAYDPVNKVWITSGFNNGMSAGCSDANGNAWAIGDNDVYQWTASTDIWADTLHTTTELGGHPVVQDTKRGQLFNLSIGNGQGGGTAVNCNIFTSGGTAFTPITLTGSGLAQFTADQGQYASMVYDPINDNFLWWDGASLRLYRITPNGTTTWDISIATTTGVTPPVTDRSFGRMQYVPALKGVVMMPNGYTPLIFMRTA